MTNGIRKKAIKNLLEKTSNMQHLTEHKYQILKKKKNLNIQVKQDSGHLTKQHS